MSKLWFVFRFIQYYLLLIQFHIRLKRRQFEGVFEQYTSLYQHIDRDWKSLTPERLHRDANNILRLVDIVCALFPFEAQCLHRSFLAYQLLRKTLGLSVELVIGVRKFPFSAHAWLMFEDGNVNESESYTQQFTVILTSKEMAS